MASPSTAVQSDSNNYTPRVATIFTINYLLGVGSLGIPNAFVESGLVFASASVVLTAIITFTTIMWICECVVRAARLSKVNPPTPAGDGGLSLS